MKAYSIFAKLYDAFMKDIPYRKWADGICGYLSSIQCNHRRILEIGCGTGTFALELAKRGFYVKGIDLSEDMVRRARLKKTKVPYGSLTSFEVQDMRTLRLDRKYPVIVSVCDSMNYLLDNYDLMFTFKNIYRTLTDDGLFIFDLKTEDYYRQLGNSVFTDETDRGYYIWENHYSPKKRNNYYYITFFVRGLLGGYRKYTERHVQHVFSREDIFNTASACGLIIKEILGENLDENISSDAARIYYVLMKGKSNGK